MAVTVPDEQVGFRPGRGKPKTVAQVD